MLQTKSGFIGKDRRLSIPGQLRKLWRLDQNDNDFV